MPVSINNTTLTFNDATTQTTAGTSNTLTAGTGISVSSPTGASTITNTGVTSVAAGSGISVSASTGAVTISASGGGVTSLNGQTGAITNTSTNTIGSYIVAYPLVGNASYSYGATISGSSLANRPWSTGDAGSDLSAGGFQYPGSSVSNPSLSGTWRAMARSSNSSTYCGPYFVSQCNLWVRVS